MPGAGFVRPAMGAAWWVLLVQMALAVLAKAPRWALTQCAAAYPGVDAKLSALVRPRGQQGFVEVRAEVLPDPGAR